MVTLRPIEPADLDLIYDYVRDPIARQMVAFIHPERDVRPVFDYAWRGILARDDVHARMVVADGEVVGYALRFVRGDAPEVGYWIDRAHWGRGFATAALRALIAELPPTRPLWARVVSDNHGSLRVLAKCGFVLDRVERDFAEARGVEVDEHVLRLD